MERRPRQPGTEVIDLSPQHEKRLSIDKEGILGASLTICGIGLPCASAMEAAADRVSNSMASFRGIPNRLTFFASNLPLIPKTGIRSLAVRSPPIGTSSGR